MIDPFCLAGEFPQATEQGWHKLVETALKGASFDQRLVTQSYDGLRVEPLYARAADAPLVAGRGAVPWQVVSRVEHPDPKAANTEARQELENGATGLSLIFAGAPGARGFGLSAETADQLDQALSGVTLEAIALRLETAPFGGRAISTLLADVVGRHDLDPASLTIDFGLDPIGDMARTGHALLPWRQLAARAGATAADLKGKGFAQARFLRADGRCVHEAGGSDAQELAFALGSAVDYLRLLEAAGFDLNDARRRISFLLAADADEFLTIAKFRALRNLWACIEQACALTPLPAFVAAESAWRMMTARDPHVNMLRTTVAVAAAGVGGADAVTVLPFTLALGLPDRLARRVARNTQLVLLEESNLYRVADPAAGSGSVEHLTAALGKRAWALFQDIEAAGGAAAALSAGLIQKKIADTRAARQAAIARRKDAITGVSDYPNLREAPVKVLDVALAPVSTPPVSFEALPSLRLAEPFETLRDKSDAILAKTGTRPKVFLATLGNSSDFTARATFARNFYEAGGIEATHGEPSPERGGSARSAGEESLSSPLTPTRSPSLPSPASGGGLGRGTDLPLSGGGKEEGTHSTDLPALVAAFKASGARFACLCSSDDVYAHGAVDAAKALRAAGAIVHLAGKPGEHEAAWKQAGVQTFIYAGCDVLSTLQAAHDTLSKP